MNLSKYKKAAYFLITVLFLIGITFAAFFDLEISSVLAGFSGANGSLSLSVPRYASFLEILGEWPAALIAGISFLLVTTVIAEKHKKQALWIRFFSVFPAACLFAYGCIKTAEYLNTDASWDIYLIIAVISIAISAAGSFFLSKIPKKVKDALFLPALYTLAAAALIFISVSALKITWGRIRPRELVAAGSLDGFTPWYLPNFFSGSRSFPSGHTAHNTLTLMLPLWLFGNGKRYRPILTAVCACFVILMGFSRITAGAHYLSDVLFGFGIAFIITEFLKYRCEKKQSA